MEAKPKSGRHKDAQGNWLAQVSREVPPKQPRLLDAAARETFLMSVWERRTSSDFNKVVSTGCRYRRRVPR